ncbi:reverse transcriptase domain-containing protein [Tanacetum coccineum]
MGPLPRMLLGPWKAYYVRLISSGPCQHETGLNLGLSFLETNRPKLGSICGRPSHQNLNEEVIRDEDGVLMRISIQMFSGRIQRIPSNTNGKSSRGKKRNADGLRVCLDKVEAVLNLPSPRCLKDVQKLNGNLASLNRFMSKSAEKSLPFFKTLKKCTKKSDFQSIADAEMAFKQMKKSIAELPMLTTPKEKEELIMYLAAAKEAISAVLMTERDEKQMPIYFVSRALQGPEINYTPMEKLVLALVSASKRLKRYFQAHTIIVITDQPIKQILSNPEVSGRLLKWSFELEEHDIHNRTRTPVKGQTLVDFIMERPKDDPQDTPMKDEEALPNPWVLFTNGSSCIDGFGAGLIITNPEGVEFTYALRFRFHATNNEAKYETLIAGLRIAEQMRVKNLQANVDSKLVAN